MAPNTDGSRHALYSPTYSPTAMPNAGEFFMSWMHQSGCYRAALGGIVCRSVAPYQKVDD